MTQTPRREFGDAGEDIARAYLTKKGYRCLASNHRTRWGEIDLVMEDGGVVVFVEVKHRSNDIYGSPEEAITPWKMKHMVRAALFYIQNTHLAGRMIRFDVVSIDEEGVRHLENAFSVDDAYYY
jgi:putative endonuclease